MTLAEMVALALSFTLALTRLLNVARPLWGYGPPWLQVLLPALPMVLTQLAGELALVRTELDLAIAIGVALVSIGVAMRGRAAGAALLVLVCGVGLNACAQVRPPTPADAYQAAKRACELYRFAPINARTPEADAACAELERVCVEPAELKAAPPAYGNKIVEL
jgi:hypothetical protein